MHACWSLHRVFYCLSSDFPWFLFHLGKQTDRKQVFLYEELTFSLRNHWVLNILWWPEKMFLRIAERKNLLMLKGNFFSSTAFKQEKKKEWEREREEQEKRNYTFSLWNSVVCEIHKWILVLFSLFPPSFPYCLVNVSTGANTWM